MSKKPSILTITIIIVISSYIPILTSPIVNASPVMGTTTFYFTDYLDLEGSLSNDSIGLLPAVSTVTPTLTNDSYYPPRVTDITTNQDKLIIWLSYWTFSFLDLSDYLGDNLLLIPSPLRIVESYDNTGEESLYINGNVDFNLDFISDIIAKLSAKDQVKVSLYKLRGFQSTNLGSTTAQISSPLLSSVSSQTVTISNIDAQIKPGESIAFSVEIVPSNSTFLQRLANENSIISTLTNTITDIVIGKLESIPNPKIQDFLDIYNEILNISDEYNFSKSDIIDLIDAVISPSLVYASVNHPASVIVPFTGASDDQNSVRYFLKGNNTMSTETPSGDSSTSVILGQSVQWNTPALSRNKILTSASANLYISHTDYVPLSANMDVSVSLLHEGSVLSRQNFTLDKTSLFSSMTKSYQVPFSLSQQGIEISYGESLSLKIEVSGNSGSVGPITFRSADILYDGSNDASSLSLSFNETNHITVTSSSKPSDGKIIAGGSVVHTLTISSKFQDDITIQKKSVENENGFWDVTIQPSLLSMNTNSEKTVQVTCQSIKYALESYDQGPLRVEVEIFGKTGYTTVALTSEVSEDAVTYSTIVSAPDIDVLRKGKNYTIAFEITNNNTGLWPNSFIYTASSANNFSVSVFPYTFDDLGVGNTTKVNVTIGIPKNTEKNSDVLIFSVKSKESGSWENTTITYDIRSSTEIADIFGFFESLAKDLGLDKTFGDFAPYVIPILIIIVVFIILIMMVFLLTSHPIAIICSEPKKDIFPTDTAEFVIDIRNRLSKKQNIDFDVHLEDDPEKWELSNVETPLILLPKESKRVVVRVRPSEMIDLDDIGIIELSLSSSLMKKPIRITLEVVIKDGETDLSIDEVIHWPRIFRANDRVSTSFKLRNHGAVQTKQVKVKLYLNGKEKNKVEDIIIPARGYAEIQIPWIAEKGKNNISLVVI